MFVAANFKTIDSDDENEMIYNAIISNCQFLNRCYIIAKYLANKTSITPDIVIHKRIWHTSRESESSCTFDVFIAYRLPVGLNIVILLSFCGGL